MTEASLFAAALALDDPDLPRISSIEPARINRPCALASWRCSRPTKVGPASSSSRPRIKSPVDPPTLRRGGRRQTSHSLRETRPTSIPSRRLGPRRPLRGPCRSPKAPVARIGPYKLLQQIGEGGMGVVYMAEQERAGPPQGRAQDHQARDGHRAGHRPVRGRAAGAGDDGSPEHRQGARRRHDRQRPPVLRDGAGQGRADHRVLRPKPA